VCSSDLLILATVASWPEVQEIAPQIAYALAIVNVLLRFVSSESIR
jgi:hypothetical protein